MPLPAAAPPDGGPARAPAAGAAVAPVDRSEHGRVQGGLSHVQSVESAGERISDSSLEN